MNQNHAIVLTMAEGENILHLEIVAGPNGSGKTTFAQSYLVRTLKRTNYLNPDIITSDVISARSLISGKVIVSWPMTGSFLTTQKFYRN